MRLVAAWLLALAMLGSGEAAQATVLVTFEGIGDFEGVGSYYDAGVADLGSGPGPDYDLFFIEGEAVRDSDSPLGGTGNFANEPSGSTVVAFGSTGVINAPNGFTDGFSLYHLSFASGTVTIWDGANGAGNLLATLYFSPSAIGCDLPGDPNGIGCWGTAGVAFTGDAHSIAFSGADASIAIFDNLTFGSAVPIPEPGNAPLIGAGLAALAALRRGGRGKCLRASAQRTPRPE